MSSNLSKAFRNPGQGIRVAMALAKGHWYKFWFPLTGRRFQAGRNLRVFGSLDLKGPGTVIFGDNVKINGHATPWTMTPEARIVLGNNVMVGNARFGCLKSITVGDDCLIAASVFTDSDYHSTRADRRTDAAPVRILPVTIERNVWISENAAILPGCTIGENSVVGFGAIVMKSFGPNLIIIGNPAKAIAPIPAMESREEAVAAATAATT